jgi:hypothetical protein
VVDIDTMTNSGLSLDLDFRIFDAASTFLSISFVALFFFLDFSLLVL